MKDSEKQAMQREFSTLQVLYDKLTAENVKLRKNAQRMPCEWGQDDEDSAVWETACDNAFLLEEGTPKGDHKFQFCCFCGGNLVEIPWQEPEGEDED